MVYINNNYTRDGLQDVLSSKVQLLQDRTNSDFFGQVLNQIQDKLKKKLF
jgi:hypothetical protein